MQILQTYKYPSENFISSKTAWTWEVNRWPWGGCIISFPFGGGNLSYQNSRNPLQRNPQSISQQWYGAPTERDGVMEEAPDWKLVDSSFPGSVIKYLCVTLRVPSKANILWHEHLHYPWFRTNVHMKLCVRQWAIETVLTLGLVLLIKRKARTGLCTVCWEIKEAVPQWLTSYPLSASTPPVPGCLGPWNLLVDLSGLE